MKKETSTSKGRKTRLFLSALLGCMALNLTEGRALAGGGAAGWIEYPVSLGAEASDNALATGAIRGKIVDRNQDLSLPGATVLLPELQKGAVSNADGSFQLLNVPAGTHQLVVRYLGYQDHLVSVEVTENKTTLVSIELSPGTVQGQEVVVFGDRLVGQAKALNVQKTNPNITNIVAADQIGRFPDANVGDAMKRIPGITVQNDQGEARFGLIRGTEPRFNTVMLNGERIPSAESDTRTVQLDLIPSDMVQSIEVSKTLTPDMDADAIGGSVNLVTRAAPNELRVSGTLGSGYNFLSQKPIYLGSAIIGKRFFDEKLGIILSGNYHNHNFGSDNVEFEWETTGPENGNREYLTDMQVRRYDVWRIRRSLSASLDYKLGTNSTIFLRTIYNRRDDYENRFRLRYRFDSGKKVDGFAGLPNADGMVENARVEVQLKGGGVNVRDRRLERQNMTSTTLSGEHLLGNRINLNWSATYAYASEDRPDERYINFRLNNVNLRPLTGDQQFANVALASPLNYQAGSFRGFDVNNNFTDERDLNTRLDVTVPLTSQGAFANSLKAGVRTRNKAKVSLPSTAFLVPSTDVTWGALETGDFSDSGYLAGEGRTRYNVGAFPTPQSLGRFENQFNATREDAPEAYLGDNFEATENITGTYLMLNQNLGTNLFVIAGARLEHTRVSYSANQLDFDEDGDLASVTRTQGTDDYLNLMPSLHLRYNLTPNTIFRAAWTNTLARPNYIDLAPRRLVLREDNELEEGNPGLDATTAMNFDLMAEHYFKSVGIVSGGVFYKDINNFIYNSVMRDYVDPGTGNRFDLYTQPQNGSGAYLRGLEVAYQRQLDFLPGFLKGFGVYTNYTFNDSRVESFPGREGEALPLPGTAKHNFNASLSYETAKLVLRASLNHHSDFIDPGEISSSGAFYDRYQDRMTQVDVNGSYAFNPRFRIFAEGNNLTNQPLRFYQGTRMRTMQAEYYNMRWQFGLKFDL
jgi:TonB-dependent receptor